MKFMHIADVHLGVWPDKGKRWSETRHQEILDTFDRLLQIAGEEQVDLLLIAGDLFHAPPTLRELEELDYKLMKLETTTTVMITGNHDYMERESVLGGYQFRSDTVCFSAEAPDSVYFEDLNTCIVGQSYDRQEITQPMYDEFVPQKEGAINILLAHGGDAKHAPMNKKKLLEAGFDYIALGHMHKPEMIVQDRMAYCGSPEPIDYTDTGKRGYILGEITEEGCHVGWHRINTRSYMHLALTLKPEYTPGQIMDGIIGEIEKLDTKNMFHIRLRGQYDHMDELDFHSLKQKYQIVDIVDQTNGSLDVETLLAEHRNDIIGQYITSLSGQEDEISQLALSMGLQALVGTMGD